MFSDALSLLDAAVAATFDERTCHVLPRRRAAGPNAGLSPDTSRPEFAFAGCLDQGPERHVPDQTGRDAPGSLGRHVNTTLVMSALNDGWPYEPGRGDAILIDGVTHTVAEIHRDGTSRILFYLSLA